MFERTLKIAQELISIPGYAELPEKESRVAMRLFDILKKGGLEVELSEVAPGRFNVLCVFRGIARGKNLLLTTHLDTVPAYDMIDPFTPVLRDGRLYGRGAVDVKGILAAMVETMLNLSELKSKLAGDVIFLAVADEESGSIGMRQAVHDVRVAGADFAVFGEPTNLDIGIAHKGVEWFEATFSGKSTHGASPEKGVNAIYHAAHFVSMLTHYLIPQLNTRIDPLLGRSSLKDHNDECERIASLTLAVSTDA